MPAMAAIQNPGPTAGDDIQVFYAQQNGNVAMVLKSGTKSKDANADYGAGAGSQKGYEVNPSQLAACRLQGFNLVVGITENASSSSATNDVSMLCPIYKPLSSAPIGNTYGSIAACTNQDGENATVFFLSGNAAKTFVSSYNFNTDSTNPYEGTPGVRPGSSLAAYWDPEANLRWFIFQSQSRANLIEWCIEDDSSNTLDSGDATIATPMAVTLTNGVVCLYYCDTSRLVRRIYKRNGKWGSASKTNDVVVSPNSQITVTSVGNTNIVFWSKDERASTTFTRFEDKIQAA